MQKSFTVYVIQNEEHRVYIGCTDNLIRRMQEHNNSQREQGWTRLRGPWVLIHQEEFADKSSAFKREKELKTGSGRKFLQGLKSYVAG